MIHKIWAKAFTSIKDRGMGLIGKKRAFPVLFETRFGIHTIGLSFPIDVIVLDEKNRVVKIKENLETNNLFFWSPIYFKVLELPAGFIKKEKIKMGDRIKLGE